MGGVTGHESPSDRVERPGARARHRRRRRLRDRRPRSAARGIGAGDTWTAEMTVLQHGVTPMENISPVLHVGRRRDTSPGSRRASRASTAPRSTFPARASGATRSATRSASSTPSRPSRSVTARRPPAAAGRARGRRSASPRRRRCCSPRSGRSCCGGRPPRRPLRRPAARPGPASGPRRARPSGPVTSGRGRPSSSSLPDSTLSLRSSIFALPSGDLTYFCTLSSASLPCLDLANFIALPNMPLIAGTPCRLRFRRCPSAPSAACPRSPSSCSASG